MKNIKLFTLAYVLFFVLFTSFVFAQSNHDLNGVFEGLRKQYDVHHRSFTQEFQYKFELTQDGDQVSGISTIYSEAGNYADVKIRGMVVGDKFYFEEYEIIDEMKSPYSVWCYKAGELTIKTDKNGTYLVGETKSYTSSFGTPCTGGYTEILRMDDMNDCFGDCWNTKSDSKFFEMDVELYPNPTSEIATVSFEIEKKAHVKVELYDLSGRLVQTALDQKLSKGIHQTELNVQKESTGLFIVKVSVDDKFYSKELVKM